MASKFFHVHHEFRAGKAQQWWETAQAAMAPGGGWDEAVAKNLEAGFYNHSFSPIGPEGPAFCIWEVREGITAEEFQEFIDGCLLYTSPSPRDLSTSRMPSSA